MKAKEMPLTVFLVTAGVILWLYLERWKARAGRALTVAPTPPGRRQQPTVTVPADPWRGPLPFTLPPVGPAGVLPPGFGGR